MRRRWIGIGVACVALGVPALLVLWCGVRQGGAPPNVVLIVIDTVRANHVGVYGYHRPTTPRIDALAGEGLRFTRAISAAPWTTASVGAMMTSQFPSTLGIRRGPVRLPEKFPLLAQRLQASGYATHGVIAAPMVAGALGFSRGFDTYDEEAVADRDDVSSPAIADKAIDVIMREHGKPFFLYVHMFDPHYNYVGHPPYEYDPNYAGKLASNTPIEAIWAELKSIDDADRRHMIALYDSEIRFTDDHVGRILDALAQRGLSDNTLVILTADHGEEFLERGWVGHSTSVHEEQIHVPLLVRGPGIAPAVVKGHVSLLDVMPTVLAWLEQELPANMDGRALDLKHPERIGSVPVFSETFNDQPHRPSPGKPIGLRAVIADGLKLIVDEVGGTSQLYDVAADPAEQKNLADSQLDKARELAVTIDNWVKHIAGKQVDLSNSRAQDVLTPEQIERLRSLGYLE